MNLFTFLLKKNGKKKLNIILLLLIIFFITFVYKGEIDVAYYSENTENRVQELLSIEGIIKSSKEWLEKTDKESEKYDHLLHQLKIAEQQKKYHEIRSQSYKEKNWKSYYEAEAKLIDLNIEFSELANLTGSDNEETYNIWKINKKYVKYMAAHHQSYFETRFSPIHGISFLIEMINKYFPLIFAILMIFLASNLYCSSYIDHIDIHRILPLSKLKKQSSKILASVVLGFGFFMFFAVFILIYSSVMEGIGSIHSPVLTYTLKGEHDFVSFMTLLPQLIILGTLSILFIINMVSLISMFIKRNIVCLILSLAVILGGMWITTNIVPLRNVAHLFPTTYISSLKVITGEMMFTTRNVNVNILNGIIILIVSNLVLFATYYFFCDFSIKRNKKLMISSNVSNENHHNDKAVNGIFSYIKFMTKRVLSRKSNVVMILLTIGISVIFLVMNMRNQSILKESIGNQIVLNEKYIETNKDELSKYDKNSDDYLFHENQIKEFQSQNKNYEEVLSNIESENWENVYATYTKVLEQQKSILEQNSGGSIEKGLRYQQKQIAYFTYLQKHYEPYENPDFPIYGLSFITSFAKIILLVIITICCIYLLAQFYTLDYVKGLDISILYPLHSKKTFVTKIMLGIVFSVTMYSLMLLSIFLITTLISGNAGLQQPFMLQNAKGTWYAVSMLSMFKEWFIIGILFSISLSIFMYIVSYLIREDMYVLILALLVVIGLAFLPTFVGGISQYAHLLPTTYMNSVNIADGTLAQQYGNPNITVSNGVFVLSVSIIIQLAVCIVLNNMHKITRLKKRR